MKRPGFAFVLVACLTVVVQTAQAAQVTISCPNGHSSGHPWNDPSEASWSEIYGPILITIDTTAYRVHTVRAKFDVCVLRNKNQYSQLVNDDFSVQRFDQSEIVISIDDQQVANDQRNSDFQGCTPRHDIETWTLNRQEGTLTYRTTHPNGATEVGKTVACEQVHGQSF